MTGTQVISRSVTFLPRAFRFVIGVKSRRTFIMELKEVLWQVLPTGLVFHSTDEPRNIEKYDQKRSLEQ
jgi:hypothetical protein